MKTPSKKLPRVVRLSCPKLHWDGAMRLAQAAESRGYAMGWRDAMESRNQDELNQLSAMARDLTGEK